MENSFINIYESQERTSRLIQQLVTVWEVSVKATHLFLSDTESKQIKEYVPNAFKEVKHLVIAEREFEPIAFMGVTGNCLEMLFLSPMERGYGLGKQLVQYGIEHYGIQKVTVNEQNLQAVGFYQHMGFKTYKRTNYDEEGNPYPLLYMRLVR